ncbi:hypothetical protein WEH80_39940 [Actinomycetes bacterium KLBMP 9759]
MSKRIGLKGHESVTAARLLQELPDGGRDAINAYRRAVCARLDRSGRLVRAEHDLGATQIGLRVVGAPDLLVVWRIDTGWYYLDFALGRPLLRPTAYLAATDPVDRLLPAPQHAASWVASLADGLRTGTVDAPPELTAALVPALLDRLGTFHSESPEYFL